MIKAKTAPFTSSVDFNVVDRLFNDSAEFTHREETCDRERIHSYLMAAIENNRAVSPENTTIGYSTAVEAVLEAAENRYPAWFDQTECDQPTSALVISKSEVEARYFNGTLDPGLIDATDYDDLATVVDPLVAIMLEDVEEQQAADRKEEIQVAKQEIRHSIYEVATDSEHLTASQIEETVDRTVAELTAQDRLAE